MVGGLLNEGRDFARSGGLALLRIGGHDSSGSEGWRVRYRRCKMRFGATEGKAVPQSWQSRTREGRDLANVTMLLKKYS